MSAVSKSIDAEIPASRKTCCLPDFFSEASALNSPRRDPSVDACSNVDPKRGNHVWTCQDQWILKTWFRQALRPRHRGHPGALRWSRPRAHPDQADFWLGPVLLGRQLDWLESGGAARCRTWPRGLSEAVLRPKTAACRFQCRAPHVGENEPNRSCISHANAMTC